MSSFTAESYVFISYKREELSHAEQLKSALESAGIRVWWDAHIQCGQVWSDALDEAVRNAGCIVVLWSERAKLSRWVMHEASIAINRGNYTPARIELTEITPPYDRHQATDLLSWDGQNDHPGLLRLLDRVRRLLPEPTSPYERWQQWLRRNAITLAASSVAAAAILMLGGMLFSLADFRRDLAHALVSAETQREIRNVEFIFTQAQFQNQLALQLSKASVDRKQQHDKTLVVLDTIQEEISSDIIQSKKSTNDISALLTKAQQTNFSARVSRELGTVHDEDCSRPRHTPKQRSHAARFLNDHGYPLSRACLSRTDLSELDLRGADLEGADLRYARLKNADLRGANLRLANLQHAELSAANLFGANIGGADLQYSELSSTNLRESNVEFASIGGAEFNLSTTWPDEFQPSREGAVLIMSGHVAGSSPLEPAHSVPPRASEGLGPEPY